jgi:type IV pilus assembly protein PilA
MSLIKRFLKQFRYGKKGFTLIEILVVVGILAVLAAVVIPLVSKFVNSGNLAAANTELSVAQTAQAAYMSENANVAGVQADIEAYANKPFHGTYVFNDDGSILAGSCTYDDFTIDTTAGSDTYMQFVGP